MITIHGTWFDGRVSKPVGAVLTVDPDGQCCLACEDGTTILERHRFGAEVSPRLGNTSRRIEFGRHGVFETMDNQAADQLLKQFRADTWSGAVHRLESRISYVLVAVVITILLGFGAMKYGVPAAARLIANRLPDSIFAQAGEQSLAILDRTIFQPSQLDAEVTDRLRRHLQQVIDNHPNFHLKVVFRKGDGIGANAIALPDGHIIFTDAMVLLAEHDYELLSVFVHETGHVARRHAMRRLVQNSLLTTLILALTGDASGVSELFLGLPVMLTELAYSREFEKEADDFTHAYMVKHGIPLHYFGDILLRLSTVDAPGETDNNWLSYLSTHPQTGDRIRVFMQEK